jgi:transposase InsO family protein
VKAVADVLGVSRSNVIRRLEEEPKARGRYSKAEDAELLPAIRSLVDERPTYGYRRIGAMLNRVSVKTFKRDYVYVHDRPDAKTVLAQLESWFTDYNEMHPHKGLKMKSPREFIRAQKVASCPI